MSGNSQAAISCRLCSIQIPEEAVPVWKRHQMLSVIASSILFAAAFANEYIRDDVFLSQAIYFAIILISGHEIIPAAFRAVRGRRLEINFLMTVAAFGAFAIGQAEEGAAVIYLFSIAEFLEVVASDKARASIRTLLRISPQTAIVKQDGHEIAKHIHDVKVGEVVVVKPGERIPVDGVVLRGNSTVNQAAITGESVPVDKQQGSTVYAGSMNGEGFLQIETTKPTDETILSKVVRLVREAQLQKSSTENFVERFSKYYTPLVVGAAILVAVFPPLILKSSFAPWIYRALVLLVVSCPCALTISTPVSMVSSITAAARSGVLIKGGRHIEALAKAKMIVFDKTGTLTEGELRVSDIVFFSHSCDEVLQLGASLEAMSEHPIAKAIVERAKVEKIALKQVTDFESIRGRGVRGKIGGHAIVAGKMNMFTNVPPDILGSLQLLQQHGKTCVLIGTQEEVFGIIALQDDVKSSAAATIRELKNGRFEIALISGDTEETTKAIGEKLGIGHYHAGLLPDEKVEEVVHLKKTRGSVAMIGDGVNDAPALAKANVGIAMGALGSDISIETADVVLMHDDLSKLPYLARLSRNTLMVVKQNIAASIIVKSSFALMALPGLISLALAVGIGDMGLSLAVILNAMRLRLVR